MGGAKTAAQQQQLQYDTIQRNKNLSAILGCTLPPGASPASRPQLRLQQKQQHLGNGLSNQLQHVSGSSNQGLRPTGMLPHNAGFVRMNSNFVPSQAMMSNLIGSNINEAAPMNGSTGTGSSALDVNCFGKDVQQGFFHADRSHRLGALATDLLPGGTVHQERLEASSEWSDCRTA